MKVGIDKINYYVPPYYVDLKELALARHQAPEKYLVGIGQEKMAVPPLEQDIVSMAANAAYPILNEEDKQSIDMVLFATESSFDFSKASSIFIHDLLGIQDYAKSIEIKQACYSGTGALQIACDYVRLRPEKKVLVVTSDISRYGLDTAGEVTQGAGAIAMLITAQPKLMSISMDSLSYTDNQFDFWRPSEFQEALVDGKYSTDLYIEIFIKLLKQAYARFSHALSKTSIMHFHLPFSKIGCKAMNAFLEQAEADSALLDLVRNWQAPYQQTIRLGKQVGNIYTGSLYLSLISSLIYNQELKAGDSLALFSYGSGAMAELVLGQLEETFQEACPTKTWLNHLNRRQVLSIEDYEAIYSSKLPEEAGQVAKNLADQEPGFYLDKIDHYRRFYGFKK